MPKPFIQITEDDGLTLELKNEIKKKAIDAGKRMGAYLLECERICGELVGTDLIRIDEPRQSTCEHDMCNCNEPKTEWKIDSMEIKEDCNHECVTCGKGIDGNKWRTKTPFKISVNGDYSCLDCQPKKLTKVESDVEVGSCDCDWQSWGHTGNCASKPKKDIS